MKREVCWLILVVAAMLARAVPTGPFELSVPIDKYTHGGISFNDAIWWAVLTTLATWIAVDIIRQLRSGH